MKCIFCKIVNGESPAKIQHEDDEVIAFDDINPKAPIHILIVPKRHIISVNHTRPKDINLLGSLILAAKKIAKEEGIDKSGYKIVINNGKEAGQLVDHLHVHLLGGKLLARMTV